jgi:lysylphosphatidylglycerol synthetase-like protein (DUF2156 family)
MRTLYSALAWIVAGGVVVQAASIAFGFGGLLNYLSDGGTVDDALLESGDTVPGMAGFVIHGIVGGMVIPAAAVALLLASFFVRRRRAWLPAAIVLVLVGVQATLGYSIADLPGLGIIHGANALAILLVAVWAALRVGRRDGDRRQRTRDTEGAAEDAVTA